MVVITVASRKGGSGKSTLTANLAAFADKASRRCLLIDADPQGSLSLWHGLRKSGEPPLRTAVRGVENLVGAAKQAGFEWVFIDTPPQMSGIVNDAVRTATLVVIPARPSVFDLDAVKETIAYARERRKPAHRPSATAWSRRSVRRRAAA
jgi:cellulose biosynthesis protein BcsQ